MLLDEIAPSHLFTLALAAFTLYVCLRISSSPPGEPQRPSDRVVGVRIVASSRMSPEQQARAVQVCLVVPNLHCGAGPAAPLTRLCKRACRAGWLPGDQVRNPSNSPAIVLEGLTGLARDLPTDWPLTAYCGYRNTHCHKICALHRNSIVFHRGILAGRAPLPAPA